MEADGDAAADAAADAGADRRNRRAIAARMKRAADAAAAGRSVRPYRARGATPQEHRQQHRHVQPSPLTRPSMAEVDGCRRARLHHHLLPTTTTSLWCGWQHRQSTKVPAPLPPVASSHGMWRKT